MWDRIYDFWFLFDIILLFVIIEYMIQNNLKKTNFNILYKGIELRSFKQELKLFRSFMISVIGEDKEGKYNPKFTREILEAVKEEPTYSFCDASLFLNDLSKV